MDMKYNQSSTDIGKLFWKFVGLKLHNRLDNETIESSIVV